MPGQDWKFLRCHPAWRAVITHPLAAYNHTPTFDNGESRSVSHTPKHTLRFRSPSKVHSVRSYSTAIPPSAALCWNSVKTYLLFLIGLAVLYHAFVWMSIGKNKFFFVLYNIHNQAAVLNKNPIRIILIIRPKRTNAIFLTFVLQIHFDSVWFCAAYNSIQTRWSFSHWSFSRAALTRISAYSTE